MRKKQAKKQPLVLRTCKICGAKFHKSKWFVDRGKANFCSKECYHKNRIANSYRMNPQTFVCQSCGKVFVDELGRERVYCSNKCCTNAFRKADRKTTDRRDKEYAKWALAVMKRDKRCVRCGATERLQAHHIKHWKNHPESRYDIDNGATLCVYCHHAQHPTIPLEKFIKLGGVSVRYCVFCESPYIARAKKQRTCSRMCGNRLRRQQEASAKQRRPA